MYVLAPNQVLETYPYSIGDLRRDNTYTSFPKNPSNELLATWDVYPVKPETTPTFDTYTQKIVEGTPYYDGYQWCQTWTVVSLTAEEQAVIINNLSNTLRSTRNQLLRATDWTQLPDCPIEDKSIFTDYRQALRNFPQQEGFPLTAVMPSLPENSTYQEYVQYTN